MIFPLFFVPYGTPISSLFTVSKVFFLNLKIKPNKNTDTITLKIIMKLFWVVPNDSKSMSVVPRWYKKAATTEIPLNIKCNIIGTHKLPLQIKI